ncbi:MAG: UbiD family decarboxylase [Caulobacteraceae bacterium]
MSDIEKSAAYHGEYDTPHVDLRDFIARAEKAGELLRIQGADRDLEMGALAEAVAHKKLEAPAVLFEDVPGFPKGFRVFSGGTNSKKRLAMLLGLPEAHTLLDLVRAYRGRMKTHTPIPPRTVETGPIFENIDRDEDVDLSKFPVPKIHEEDGGRYIGTDDLVIMRDPDEGWVNAATYRVQVHSRNTTGLWISPGKQGRQIRDKYHNAGKPCPVLICCGHDPVLFLAASQEVRYGLSEFDYAGGHRGLPYDVVMSEVHGLPMPAHAEIVLEGEMLPGDNHTEGPFGEFTGYYASPQSNQPVVRINRVYYRNDPILTMATPMRPPTDLSFAKCIVKAGMIWDEVERAGLSGVKGVWCHEAGISRMFNVISIKQGYAGHSRQAGMLASTCQGGAYLGRFTVVVDDDVDPTDIFDVLWAMCTRCDPAEDIDIIRKMWSGPLDPLVPHGSKGNYNSRAVIDACRPYHRLGDFPKVARASPTLLAEVKQKFAHFLDQI